MEVRLPREASGAGSIWILPSEKPAKSHWTGAVMGGSAKHSDPSGAAAGFTVVGSGKQRNWRHFLWRLASEARV